MWASVCAHFVGATSYSSLHNREFSRCCSYNRYRLLCLAGRIYISRTLHGVGTSGLMVGGMSVLMRSVPKKQLGRYSSMAWSSAGHAPLVAPILSGLMYNSMDQTWSFLIPAIIIFTVSSVSYILLARIWAVPRIQSSESQLQTIEKRLIWPCVKSMFSSPLTYVAIIGVFSFRWLFVWIL